MDDNLVGLIEEEVTSQAFGIWFLIGAALVFFMQCGFAMVETGFTRAKNAGNIIMKNLMDFCIGTIVFVLLGFGLMMSENYVAGLIGIPNFDIFSDYADFDYSNFFFQLVFCATAATIVSGAMAERTKFSTYCIYSAVISAFVYPIEAGWVWNSQGWLAQLGYHDFAGSSVIHMVGGVTALIGAAFLGPRIGKYERDENGKVVKVNAIQGHALTFGALGAFILWFAWYGFNGAAATDVASLGSIFLTTTIAPAVATCTTMAFTWIKNKKPDVSMCLNACLAGLVGVTAGCDVYDCFGSAIIGLVSGILIVVVCEGLDQKLHIDDPVGAVGVHCANGLWGGIAVGLFNKTDGLFYTWNLDGLRYFGVQLLGVAAILLYAAVMMTVIFVILKKTIGLRVSAEEEIEGLDPTEHGLSSAYADFVPTIPSYVGDSELPFDATGVAPAEIELAPSATGKYTNITIIARQEKFNDLKSAMAAIGVTGMTVSTVMGCGAQGGKTGQYRGVKTSMYLLPKVKVEIVVSTVDPKLVVAVARKVLCSGNVGDGKIFVTDVENVMRVRTGETGVEALSNEAD